MKGSDAFSVRLAVPAQVLRGALSALTIYPFREVIIGPRLGWLKLFFLMFFLTSAGAVITGPGSLEGLPYTRFSFSDPVIGYPEIILQMLGFALAQALKNCISYATIKNKRKDWRYRDE